MATALVAPSVTLAVRRAQTADALQGRRCSPTRHGVSVVLPPSIVQWTNLWDAMDLLAFNAGTVFRLYDVRQRLDICVQDTASELMAHKARARSIYSKLNQMVAAIKASFNGAA